ncbi:MAG: insulinase family protein [Ruminococcus sp.]|nr:insulinase family protein [Ruminococcus sp.]
MKYNRTEISDKIGFSSVTDPKFKTNLLTVRFITSLDSKTVSANTLGVSILSDANSKFKTIAEMSKKLSSLYGAGISSFSKKRGDLQILGFTASWINGRYAFDGEDLDAEMAQITRDCLFSPNAENGEFDSEIFKIAKKDLLDRIDAELNNKRGYALSRAEELAFKGEPAEVSCTGKRENAEKVTPADAYRAYQNILKTSQIEIIYVSSEENNTLKEMFAEEFAKIERQPREYVFASKSPLKSDVETLSEELDVRQCKMVMTFKTDSDDKFAISMLSMIYGATPVSKLFMNVREKMSLCYYCASRFSAIKNVVAVDSGVEKSNIEKAKAEILNQLDEIIKGNITDEEMQSALLSLDNAYNSIGDTPSSYSNWYFERFCDGKIVTPQEHFKNYPEVTKARIIQAASSLKLDSIYYMLSKEAE